MKKTKTKLFGRKKSKKYSFKNTFKSKFVDSIKFYEYRDNEPEIVDNRYDGVPFLPRGKLNYSISNNLLSQLPPHLQRCWNRIDLGEYFKEPVEVPEPPEPPEIEPTPDLFQLIKDKEKRIKLKSIILGELNEKSEE